MRLPGTTGDTRPLYVALLCMITLVAGCLSLRQRPGETATAIRVASARDLSRASNGPLPELMQEVRARAMTSPTRPPTAATSLLEKAVSPAVAVPVALTKTDSGVASWFGAPAATCAHRTLPMGTVVKVTRNHNGASATCKVDDRGPTVETGRLIDLSLDTFEKLAASEAGLIDVRIEW